MFYIKLKQPKLLFDIGENFKDKKNISTNLFKPKSFPFSNKKPTRFKNKSIT